MEVSNESRLNRFYLLRFRFYSGVIAFIIFVGLPLIAVPSLRHRLGSRLYTLKEAAGGSSGRSSAIVAQVGQNPQPFPAQYEKPIVIPQKPALPMLIIPQGSGAPQIVQQSPAQPPAQPSRSRALKVPTKPPGNTESDTAAPTQGESEGERSLEPEFRQGQMEKEAYDLLLGWNPNLDQMVRGSSATLQFKNWSAAKREEDTYWVRILFQNVPDKAEVAYIWEVKISSKQVTPLNYSARSLPKP